MTLLRNSRYLLPGILLLTAAGIQAQEWKIAGGFNMDWPTVTVATQPLSGSVYYMHGSGGNMLVSAGEDGILLVDDEFAEISAKILAAVAAIQPGPVRFVLNTHFHSDHAGGNALLGEQGATIIAHSNARLRMLTEQRSLFFGSTTPPSPAAALPVVTFPEGLTLHFNGEAIDFFFVSAAHTDGDAIVYFTSANVVHMGDIYINELYPIIDLAGGGNIDGYLPALDAVLARIDDNTRVVPGHGPIGDKTDLQFYRDMLALIRDRVKEKIAAGEDLNAILAANLSSEFDPGWASDRVGPGDVVTMIYQSLTGI